MGQGAPKRCQRTDYALAELRRQVKRVAPPLKAVVARLPLLAGSGSSWTVPTLGFGWRELW